MTKQHTVKKETKVPATLLKQGVWHNNPTLVQLLGLCPLLAVSSTATECSGFRLCYHYCTSLHQYSNFIVSCYKIA